MLMASAVEQNSASATHHSCHEKGFRKDSESVPFAFAGTCAASACREDRGNLLCSLITPSTLPLMKRQLRLTWAAARHGAVQHHGDHYRLFQLTARAGQVLLLLSASLPYSPGGPLRLAVHAARQHGYQTCCRTRMPMPPFK